MYQYVHEIVAKIKQIKPLILNITNEVTINFVANGLLSLGASPVMSKAQQEASDLVGLSHAIVINPGTLNDEFIALSQAVCTAVHDHGKPWVLDPVGAGASQYRTKYNQQMIEAFHPTIIRANASEIMALSGESISTKGVDSSSETQFAIESAQGLAEKYNTIVLISGETDAIVDGHRVEFINRGSSVMPMITGTGCLLSAVVAAFCAIDDSKIDAAMAAALFYSVCGELAEQQSSRPGSFKTFFLDALSLMPESCNYE